MPKTVRTIACCYCDAATMIDLTRIGRGVLTCDACGARLSSARMEAVVNKPVPMRQTGAKRTCGGASGTLDIRWQDVHPQGERPRGNDIRGAIGSIAGVGVAAAGSKQKSKESGKKTKYKLKKSRPKKRKSFLDRLEDIWDEIEDIID